MLIPVVLTVLPLLCFVSATRRRLEVISAMLLLGFVVVGALSIGLFYAPSAMAMLIAAALAKAGQRHANLRSRAGSLELENMPLRGLINLFTWGALTLGAICSLGLIGYVGGGWKRSALGYIAWALLPYLVLSIVCALARLIRLHRAARLTVAWAAIAFALIGPLLYVDAMLIHVDAQGALVILMVPVIQLALTCIAVVAAVVWQVVSRHIRI